MRPVDMPPAAQRPPREAALIDAAITVQRWRRISPWQLVNRHHVRHHVAREMRCEPAWGDIEATIVRRLLAADGAGFTWNIARETQPLREMS